MNMVLDIGNTRTKVGIYNQRQEIRIIQYEHLTGKDLEGLIKFNKVSHTIVGATGDLSLELKDILVKTSSTIFLDAETSIPIKNLYKTPETLGNDRLASAVAAARLHDGKNVLIIDAGTCITYDFLNAHAQYLGGSISPGIEMRFKALDTFTDKLPLVRRSEKFFMTGRNTNESILSGVLQGTLSEVENRIGQWKSAHSDLVVLLTGGDFGFFETHLKSQIFAVPNLVLKGLNEILEHNIHGN